MVRGGRSIAVAGVVMLAAAGAQSAQGAEKAGVAAAVKGDVTVSGKPRPEPRPAESGMDMLLFDRVITEAESRMQVLLLDQTNFSVGPNSELVIDEFVYDPDKGSGKVAAEFVEGVFRYVSGNVGRNDPENVEVETAAGTIGVRGTALFARADAQSQEVFVGLLGPGDANNAGLNRGGFTFSNEQGSTEVLRSGYGVRASPGEAPSAPVRIPDEVIDGLQQSLQGRPGGAAEAEPAGTQDDQARVVDPAQASGQTQAAGRELGDQVLARAETEEQLTQSQSDAVEEGASRMASEIPEQVEDMPDGAGLTPSANALLAQVTWGDVDDLDLHVTGPRPDGEGRFHTYFASPGSLDSAPFAALDQDFIGRNGSEVAAIEQLNAGGPTRISVFNFGAEGPASESTALANQSDAMLQLLRGGSIERVSNGSDVVDGEQLEAITPPADQPGNTWVGFEIDPQTEQVEIINQIETQPNSAAVR